MLLELMCALGCRWLYPGPLADLGLGCVALLWLSTALLSVPCHNRLVREFSPSVVNRLVQTNWVRTVLWSLRTALSAWFILVAA